MTQRSISMARWVIGDVTDPDLIRNLLDDVNSRVPLACHLGGRAPAEPL